MSFQCKKCGFTEARTQLREVLVTVGWSTSQFKSAAVCQMCLQCGDVTCNVEVTIGKFLNLVPGANPPPPGERAPAPAPKEDKVVVPLKLQQEVIAQKEREAAERAARGEAPAPAPQVEPAGYSDAQPAAQ